jgi:hypothetical protein
MQLQWYVLMLSRYAQFLDCTGCDDDVRTLYEAIVGR